MKFLSILVAIFIFSGCPEEEELPEIIINEPILISPGECVLVCKGTIIRRESDELCEERYAVTRPMCEDWTRYFPNINYETNYVLP